MSCSFFLLQSAIWVEDASNIRDRRSVSVLLIRQTDPKIKGGHDRLVVGSFTAMTLGLLVFFKYMDFLADSVNRDYRYTCSDGADRTSGRHQFLHVSDHQLLCGCLPGRGCGRTQFC